MRIDSLFIYKTYKTPMIMKQTVYLALALLVVACSQPKSNEGETASSETAEPTLGLEKLWATDTLLTTSESVIYDETNDVLYVSCINGAPPDARDEDGFIAKVSPADGSIIELQWVTSMDAPKGLGLIGSTLYVTDIDDIVAIDVTTGEITQKINVPDAVFLNDITTDDEGNVYFTDSGANRIHKLSADGELSLWIEDAEIGGPNGLLDDGDQMMMVAFGKGIFNTIDYASGTITQVADSLQGGDGIEKTGDDYLVSSWHGRVFYITAAGETTKLLDTSEDGSNAADIEFIAKSNTLLVPTFFGNQVVAYKLTK